MSVKYQISGIKPYCFLKALGDSHHSIYLHNGKTTRISRDGRVLQPMEDYELTHVRVKPNLTKHTLSVIYVNNFKGCWINGCVALCWYEYVLIHGHLIKLQPNAFEYRITFFPTPDTEEPDFLLLKIPKSLTEIPPKVMEEIVAEAKSEFWNKRKEIPETKLPAKITQKPTKTKVVKRNVSSKKSKKNKIKVTKKSGKQKVTIIKSKRQEAHVKKSSAKRKPAKSVQGKKKLLKKRQRIKKRPVRTSEPKVVCKHVHFETRPKTTPQRIEMKPSEIVEYFAAAGMQTADDTYLTPSGSLSRRVIFKPTPEAPTVERSSKCVRFAAEGDSVKSVVFVEPEDEDIETSDTMLTKNELIERVLSLYERMQDEEKQHKTDKQFVMSLIDKLLRKTYNVKVENAQFIIDFLGEVVEDAVTMKEKDVAFVRKIVDDAVDNAFVDMRSRTEDGFFEKLLGEIFARIPEREIRVAKSRTMSELLDLPSISSADDSSRSDDVDQKSIIKEIYEI